MENVIVSNDVLMHEVVRYVAMGKVVSIKAKGQSMLPFIRETSDSINLRACGNFGIGDVVLARLDNGAYVVHRVMAIRGDEVELMGDGNLVGREHCHKSQVAGIAYSVNRCGREISLVSSRSRFEARLWKLCRPQRRRLLRMYHLKQRIVRKLHINI